MNFEIKEPLSINRTEFKNKSNRMYFTIVNLKLHKQLEIHMKQSY